MVQFCRCFLVISIMAFGLVAFTSETAFAQYYQNECNVEGIQPRMTTIDTTDIWVFTDASCPVDAFLLQNSLPDTHRKQFYSLLLAAQLSGRKVHFFYVDYLEHFGSACPHGTCGVFDGSPACENQCYMQLTNN